MSAKPHAESACAEFGTDTTFPSEPWEGPIARFTARWASSSTVVTAHGELDASNAGQLADYVQRCAAHSRSLILDLRDLEFFGTEGFSTLHTINVQCAGADVLWAVLPSQAVSRVLRICDPDDTLPMTQSVAAASDENKKPRRLLELVSQSR
ncbi:MAG: STAS domain-containing protein [Mycobacterium sp.]